jgi:hypothetical protein
MPAWERDTPWRQGHVVPDDALESLDLLSTDSLSEMAAIVVSHDCDLAQSPGVEPAVEIIVGHWVTAVDGNFSFGKNARRLHLSFSGGSEVRAANLIASRKIPIEKTQLAGYTPVETVQLSALELTILQRWLAARYRRSAFPDEFDKRLEETGLRDRLGKILKIFGTLISAIYFDVDQGDEVIRSGSERALPVAPELSIPTKAVWRFIQPIAELPTADDPPKSGFVVMAIIAGTRNRLVRTETFGAGFTTHAICRLLDR